MTREELQILVGKQLGRRRVGMHENFFDDLGAVSMDMMNIIATVEELTGINISEDAIPGLQTVEELYQYISNALKVGPEK